VEKKEQVHPSSETAVYPHMSILRVASTLDKRMGHWPIRPILGFWGAKLPKMGDSLPWTQMNLRAKFDAASFITARDIHNRTNTQNNTNSNRYIYSSPIGMCG